MARSRSDASLKRKPPQKDPKLRIYAYCEGESTEPQYLRAFALDHGNRLVEILPIGVGGVPETVVRAALDKKRAIKRDRTAARDQVWAIFDEDDHPNVEGWRQSAKQGGVEVAFSSPCFELWALLHYRDHGAPCSHKDMENHLKRAMPGYDPDNAKQLNYDDMKGGYVDARRRAQALQRARGEDGATRPYTDVDVLMQLIIENGKP